MKLVLPADATREMAVAWLKRLIRDFGYGFHLDWSPEEYTRRDGGNLFSRAQIVKLKASLERLFAVLGDELPYEICASEAATMLAETLGMKPPLEYNDSDFQQQLLPGGTRDELIHWLCWNDPNGI